MFAGVLDMAARAVVEATLGGPVVVLQRLAVVLGVASCSFKAPKPRSLMHGSVNSRLLRCGARVCVQRPVVIHPHVPFHFPDLSTGCLPKLVTLSAFWELGFTNGGGLVCVGCVCLLLRGLGSACSPLCLPLHRCAGGRVDGVPSWGNCTPKCPQLLRSKRRL